MKRARVNELHVTVVGNVRTVVLSPGVEVDLDQVVGHQHGQPRTLAQELRPEWLAQLDVVQAASARLPAGPQARRGASRVTDTAAAIPSVDGPTHAQEKE
jgi:hypothetical protein